MARRNLFMVFVFVTTITTAVCWGFAAESDEVLKPQLQSPLRLKSANTSSARQNVSRPNNPALSGRNTGTGNQNISGAMKEETAERIMEENSREVLETQHATCMVTTEELVATAQATVTRVLKGLCNRKELEDRFHNMETQLAEQLNVIKAMLLSLEDRITEQDQASRRGQRRIMGNLLRHCQPAVLAPITSNNYNNGKISEEDAVTTWEDEDASNEISESPRDKEINRYNSTIHAEPIPGQQYSSARSRVFTYYWRIRGMENKLTRWKNRWSLRSPSFYISPGGYRMYIRIYPRQNEENVYVHVGITKGDYDNTLPWPFKLKHRINILDQVSSDDSAQEDINSRVWDPTVLCSGFNWQRPVSGDNYECVGLGFPHSVIRTRHYIRDDAIIIKLSVYLD